MERETPIDIGTLILSEPDFREGQPFIAGTRRSVKSIAAMFGHGATAEEIAAELPEIPKAKIYAALTYYFANAEQIDADLVEDERLYYEFQAEYEAASAPVAVS